MLTPATGLFRPKNPTGKNDLPKNPTGKNDLPKNPTGKNDLPKKPTGKNDLPKKRTGKNDLPKKRTGHCVFSEIPVAGVSKEHAVPDHQDWSPWLCIALFRAPCMMTNLFCCMLTIHCSREIAAIVPDYQDHSMGLRSCA